jgi:hypothetical protein
MIRRGVGETTTEHADEESKYEEVRGARGKYEEVLLYASYCCCRSSSFDFRLLDHTCVAVAAPPHTTLAEADID